MSEYRLAIGKHKLLFANRKSNLTNVHLGARGMFYVYIQYMYIAIDHFLNYYSADCSETVDIHDPCSRPFLSHNGPILLYYTVWTYYWCSTLYISSHLRYAGQIFSIHSLLFKVLVFNHKVMTWEDMEQVILTDSSLYRKIFLNSFVAGVCSISLSLFKFKGW